MKSQSLLFVMGLLATASVADVDLGVKAQGLGGAYRAVALSNDTIFYNPAGLSKEARFAFDADYKMATDAREHQLGLSIVDSTTSPWGVGIAYNAGMSSADDVKATHLFYMATSTPLIGEIVSFGTAFSYFYDPNLGNDPYHHFFNMDLGVLLTLPGGVSVGVVVDHFLAPKGNEKALGLSTAAAINLGDIVPILPLVVAFDWTMDNVTSNEKLDHIVSTGLQYTALGLLPIRVGFKSSVKEDTNVLSMGAGLYLSGFGIDGLYQQNLTVGRIRHFGFSLSFQM